MAEQKKTVKVKVKAQPSTKKPEEEKPVEPPVQVEEKTVEPQKEAPAKSNTKTIIIAVCAIALAALVAFFALNKGGTSNSGTEEVKYDDQAFLADFQKGLEARWDLATDGVEETASEEFKNAMTTYNAAEYSLLEKYKTGSFEDTALQAQALNYINLLEQEKETFQYITVDLDKYLVDHTAVYDQRSKLITELITKYNLVFPEKYASTVADFQTNSNMVKEDEDTRQKLEAAVQSLAFNEISKEYDWSKYQATFTNTTGKKIDQLWLVINLLDENGVSLGSETYVIEQLEPNASAYVSFETDKKFATTKVDIDEIYYA